MNDDVAAAGAGPAPAGSAGSLLRQAREAQGLHIAALAASLKVPPRKLEALERDRYDELPDPAFTRALAQSICRTLKIDAAPVLAQLPRAVDGGRLDQVAVGLNTPFRERPTAAEPAVGNLLSHPVVWVVALLLLAAAAIYFWPATTPAPVLPGAPDVTLVPSPSTADAPPAAPAVPQPQAQAEPPQAAPAASEPVVETVHSAPEPTASEPAAPVPGMLALRVSDASWIEVTDGGGRVLLSRTVQPGEAVGLDGRLPLRLTIGNASATEVLLRGQPVDLTANTRDNIARLELK